MRDARDRRDEVGIHSIHIAPFSHISRLAVMEKDKEKPKPKMRVSAFPEGETC